MCYIAYTFSHTEFPSIKAVKEKSIFATGFLIFGVRWDSALKKKKRKKMALAEKKGVKFLREQ